MSYILDALKKSQSEQTADGVALRLQQVSSRRGIAAWLIGAVGLVLVLNALLLVWLFVWRDAPLETGGAKVATSLGTNPVPSGASTTQADTPATSSNNVPQPIAPGPAVQVATPQSDPTVTTPEPAQTASSNPAPVTRVPVAASVPRVLLTDLSPMEQTLYNGFSYSTHIYTDDPSLCAIVVDGERLVAGDAFKGLKVVAITESGVVFEENRRGSRRQVEVSVLEQWED